MAKRTLDAFFQRVTGPAQKRSKPSEINNPHDDQGSPSQHPTYPSPIAQLPSHIEVGLVHAIPASTARTINNQPHLDLLYFQPYIARTTANELFKFLRRELPFYRVQYNIRRGDTETQITTPRFTTVFGVDETSKFVPRSSANTNTDRPQSNTSTPDDEDHPASLILVDSSTTEPIPASKKYQSAPRPIPTCLDLLRKQVEDISETTYNVCLVNYYASGEDSIAFHSDDERFLGSNPTIASLSLGAEREFLMKHKPVVPPETGTRTPAAGPPPRSQSNSASNFNSGGPYSSPPLKLGLASGDMVIMRGATQSNWLHSIPKRKGRAAERSSQGRINITFRKAVVPGGTNNYYRYNVGDGGAFRWDETQRRMIQSD
ncbi:Oxoglutarate/iron-dependent dioxygenase [Penicillium riverlandense]|uniref:Oxoglutarate/iron-dependent dioxygenase n=1 Tax=Penicillium riverlandense TaxID=1903569 RepID=UPI002548EFF8|nr:Oxoglutarate/iron-dependent dioxygenase [Penicillium riverlandense]KAJ5833916.1 Oxoglutarate/iron-dependent dioxygenase [Penicillium riverlandense]